MPLELQVKLLRVLETSAVTRVGGSQPVKVDVRIIAATNRRLEDAVAAGKLREDLLYRLNVFPIPLPPLRERGDDVERLAEHFLGELNAAEGTAKQLTAAGRERLRRHGWPGNLRELKNVVQRAFILAEEGEGVDPIPEPVVDGDALLEPADAGGDSHRGGGAPSHPGHPREVRGRQEEGRGRPPHQPEHPLQPPERIQDELRACAPSTS